MFFEIDDAKRRHSITYDVYNVFGWVDTPDSGLTWSWVRGSIAGVTGCAIQSVYSLYHSSY